MSVQYGGDKITFSDGSTVGSGWSGFKNRLINSDMRIDQRNAGASITASSAVNAYNLDRWQHFKQSSSGSFTIQQSSVAPAGFTNSILVTVTSAYSDTSTSVNSLVQWIEGLNVADFAWGTADAQPITISFKVRSSVTGTYNLTISNDGYNRNYCTSYTINSANTWETKTVTIAGDTSGTWLKTNGVGLRLWFDIGSGSSRIGTANTWQATEVYRTSGSVQFLANSGATFYITGVQLEKGSTATSFDYRPYGTELALCQRYFEKSYSTSTAVASVTSVGYFTVHATSNAYNNIVFPLRWQVQKRANPTVTAYSTDGVSGQWFWQRNGANGNNTVSFDNASTSGCRAYVDVGAAWSACGTEGQFVISSEL